MWIQGDRSCEFVKNFIFEAYLQTNSHGSAYNPVLDRLHSCKLLSQKINVISELEVRDPVTVAKLLHEKY